MTFRNHYYININGGFATTTFDYWEPRVEGRFFKEAANYWMNYNIHTDRRKPLNFYFHFGHASHVDTDQNRHSAEISANCRIGQKFNINYTFNLQNKYAQYGFINKEESAITFAQRNVFERQNILSLAYVINNKAGLKLRARH
jgi:hypothetical protein